MDSPMGQPGNTDWLSEVLDEVGLRQFYSKLTNDLQLTKLSHFDFVSEEDLIHLGMSRPAARRLSAAIKKRKSFVTALKNKIVSKLLPTGSSSPFNSTSSKNKHQYDPFFGHLANAPGTSDKTGAPTEFKRLTCLINSQDVQIKEEIGHGVHGFVKKGEWTTPNGRVVEVALKILRKDVRAEPGASFNDFVKEISVMHQLNHPNIIKLYGVVLSSPMMMVTELAPFGNLRDRLRKENGSTPISQLINFGVQIAYGMEYLETKRLIHRDLAARNIFITHGRKILIGDLGLMRAMPTQEDYYVMSETTKIPYPWCAPESLKYKQFSSASDVYMFGVTLWEMFSFGKEPWAGLKLMEILEIISTEKKRLFCPESCPAMVYQTLLQCWNTEPTCRPNFSTLYQYLSTSYPLEVRSIQHISESGQKRQNGNLLPDDLSNSPATAFSSGVADNESRSAYRKVLICSVDDRILVIDGQPEKYWWKGQNQRTFEIGWFPLCSTRWLAPKKGSNFISRPLKGSFVHAGHCGPNGKWGSPRFIDYMYLKNPLEPDDMNNFNAAQTTAGGWQSNNIPKSKAKSRLTRLFGLHETSQAAAQHRKGHFLAPKTYRKFNDEAQTHYKRPVEHASNPLVRSQSDELTKSADKIKDTPPLIDLSDDAATVAMLPTSLSLLNTGTGDQQQQQQQQQKPSYRLESLIDMDNEFPQILTDEALHRRSSDTKLNQIDDTDNYRLSWAGSWNTGTFDGSESNVYSAYYSPQDADIPTASSLESDANRYYSAVAHEDDRLN